MFVVLVHLVGGAQAEVRLPRAHRHVLQADDFEFVNFDVTRTNTPAGICVGLHGFLLHFLENEARSTLVPVATGEGRGMAG